jgi:hypothetical protein
MKKGQHEPPDTIRPSLGGAEPFEALFEHARRDAFSPEEAERLWQSVVAAGPGAGDTGADISGGLTRGWISGTAFKVAVGLIVVGGLVAAALVARRSGSRETATIPSGTVQMAPGVEAPRGAGGPPMVSWEDLPRVAGEARPAPRARGRVEPPVQAPEALPAGQPESAGEPPQAVQVEPGPAPAAPVPAPSEGALLLRARQQLASDPQSALELTDEAGRRFPDGALAPEREVLAIEALARLGRVPSARARFAAFKATYPGSPHLARLASLVGP